MIEYIENNARGSNVFYTDQEIESSKRAIYHIEWLCKKSLFTYKGYIQSIKKELKLSYQIPVYINDTHGFIPISRVKDYENKWINWFAVHKIHSVSKGLDIEFISGRRLYINYSVNRMQKRIEALMKIKSMKVNIFIFNDIEIISK